MEKKRDTIKRIELNQENIRQLEERKQTNKKLQIPCYKVHAISFQTFFVWAFKNVVDSWKFNMLWLYILWDDWLIFLISGWNEQLQQELEYT